LLAFIDFLLLSIIIPNEILSYSVKAFNNIVTDNMFKKNKIYSNEAHRTDIQTLMDENSNFTQHTCPIERLKTKPQGQYGTFWDKELECQYILFSLSFFQRLI